MIDFGQIIDQLNRRTELDRLATYFIGDITPEEAERFNKTLWIIAQNTANIVVPENKKVHVFINSSGGDVSAGFAMMEMIYRVRRDFNVPVITIVTGCAYSMGAVVLQAGTRRIMGTLSTLMLHSPSWVLAGKDTQVFQDYERLSEEYRRRLGELFATRTGYKNAKWWTNFIYSARDRFLGADECLSLGLVDEVTDIVL